MHASTAQRREAKTSFQCSSTALPQLLQGRTNPFFQVNRGTSENITNVGPVTDLNPNHADHLNCAIEVGHDWTDWEKNNQNGKQRSPEVVSQSKAHIINSQSLLGFLRMSWSPQSVQISNKCHTWHKMAAQHPINLVIHDALFWQQGIIHQSLSHV